MRRIFISSTAEDLGQHRERVLKSVMRQSLHPVAMEFFGAQPGEPVDVCRRYAAEADAVVVIVAHRFGWVPREDEGGDGERSITWHEAEAAERAGKPVFAFLVDPAFPWPYRKEQDDLVEASDDAAALLVFRRVQALKRLRAWLGHRVTDRFTTPEDLADKMTGSLSRWMHESVPSVDGVQLTELRYEHGYLNAQGDYKLRATYAVENRGQLETSRLLLDSTRFFVEGDRGLAGAVTLDYPIPDGGRYRLRGALQLEDPESVVMPDGQPARRVVAAYWHPRVAPAIPAGGSLTYTCLLRGAGTERDAFGPDGSYAGMPALGATRRIVLLCRAPSGYRFDPEKLAELSSTDTHAAVVIEGLPRAELSPEGDVVTWTIEGRALRANVHYNLALRIVPREGLA